MSYCRRIILWYVEVWRRYVVTGGSELGGLVMRASASNACRNWGNADISQREQTVDSGREKQVTLLHLTCQIHVI